MLFIVFYKQALLYVLLPVFFAVDNDICDTHLVNGGIYSVGNDSVSVQFEGTGPTSDEDDQVTEYQCIVTDDDGAREPESCELA